jgi:hypothetical protein
MQDCKDVNLVRLNVVNNAVWMLDYFSDLI